MIKNLQNQTYLSLIRGYPCKTNIRINSQYKDYFNKFLFNVLMGILNDDNRSRFVFTFFKQFI